MMFIENEVNRILLEAKDSSISLRQLYELYRRHTRKFSLSFICRRSGIPSKGYFSFVMSGNRRLNSKYWPAITEVFKLNSDQAEVMQLLLERDAEPLRKSHYDEIIATYRSRLNRD
jgi:hypothetical protein